MFLYLSNVIAIKSWYGRHSLSPTGLGKYRKFTESNRKLKGFKFLKWHKQNKLLTSECQRPKVTRENHHSKYLCLTSHWMNGSVFKLQDPTTPILMTQVTSLPHQSLLNSLIELYLNLQFHCDIIQNLDTFPQKMVLFPRFFPLTVAPCCALWCKASLLLFLQYTYIMLYLNVMHMCWIWSHPKYSPYRS